MGARTTGVDPRDERGEISSWFTQLLVVMVVVGLVIYEAVALAFAAVQVDDVAREVARVARDEYRAEQSLSRARALAEETAGEQEASVVDLDTDGTVLRVTVARSARTLVVHRIDPLAERLTPTATREADL
jgi:hypothetical protein